MLDWNDEGNGVACRHAVQRALITHRTNVHARRARRCRSGAGETGVSDKWAADGSACWKAYYLRVLMDKVEKQVSGSASGKHLETKDAQTGGCLTGECT